MLELVDEKYFWVVLYRLGYLQHRPLLLYTLIVLFACLHDHIVVVISSMPTVIDYLNGAIEVDMAAELQLGLLMLELLRLRLSLDDLALLLRVFFRF